MEGMSNGLGSTPVMPINTESAVVAVFDNSVAAEAAAAELVANAYASDHIHLAAKTPAGSEQPGAGHREPDIKQWVESVFAQDNETERQHYEEVVRDGSTLLGVSTPDQMAGQAADILNRYEPAETVLARIPVK